jgi:AcrR family transcriptional regulator
MFTKIGKAKGAKKAAPSAKRGRGRPRGTTEQGAAARLHLYETAIDLIAARGYEATTLRDIASAAQVSPGLLYRYFPSKRALVLALYDELSQEYAARASRMQAGPWRDRFLFALRSSLRVLGPRRPALSALTAVLIGDADEGLFAPSTAFSRERVRAAFIEAVRGASDAPAREDVEALGGVLYLIHLGVILWWLLDKSPGQKATTALLGLLERMLPAASLALRLQPARSALSAFEALCREGLFGVPAPHGGQGVQGHERS